MKIEKTGNISCIRDIEGDLFSFFVKISDDIKTFEDQHIIVDLLSFKKLINKQIEAFSFLSQIHKKNKKSFVIVAENIDYNAISFELSVVPTKAEAFDIIEMENIERDLGF